MNFWFGQLLENFGQLSKIFGQNRKIFGQLCENFGHLTKRHISTGKLAPVGCLSFNSSSITKFKQTLV
ncbi:hypothetical protein FZC76_14305 [Sutcliffiella horikoshii]|uniref:Uncharacterized protein n=1 Tax=Sutcliffiella horikoshii TaxID=79883 RepID=A0A5D4SWF1_9BACI|nr:hypothetical protein FZC76_14305 [Sutcliffiella horikoshii]